MERLLLVLLLLPLGLGEERTGRLLVDPYEVMRTELQAIKSEVQNLNSEISMLKSAKSNLETTVTQLSSKIQQGNGGATFIRWGRKTCPDNASELVYSGYAGGSGYRDTGGSSEFLCLTPNPVFTNKTLPNEYTGHLYGTEYESIDFFAQHGQDEDVPCTVCRSHNHASKLIIPGTNVCVNGWKKEYSGFLAGNNYKWAGPEEWICVDEHPEFLPGGIRNDNGRVLHPVTTVCGSLQCPPYQDHKVVTCVVCTK